MYEGIKEIELNDEDLARFYETKTLDVDLYINEYVVIKSHNEIVDKYKWNGNKLVKLKGNNLDTRQLGKLRAKDARQECLIDALLNDTNNHNNVVLIKGKPGSGKSLFSLAYGFYAIEKGLADRIIIMANPLVVKNSAKLGFYPGSRDEKLTDSFLGNMLISKIGDKETLLNLINSSPPRISLLPVGDIRGYETGERMILYVPEGQNLDINLMKLILQRVGEGTKIIIDGDIESQVDLDVFEGESNGIRRVSEVFRGEDIFSEITLKNIYRSKIALIADRM